MHKQDKKGANPVPNSKPDTAAINAMGKAVFAKTCSACHGNPLFPKAPSLSALSAMEPRVILNSLDNGKMKLQASVLTEQQREAVAQFITKKTLKTTVTPRGAYTTFALGGKSNSLYDYSGWGGNLEGSGFRSAAQAGITMANVASLQLKWAFAFPDASEVRSKPAIAGNWIIVGSQSGEVYALNRKTGKIGWQVAARAAIRSGIVVVNHDNTITAYFADASTYTYAVDVKKGKILWRVRAGSDPLSMNTGTLAVYGGRVFVPISSFEVAMAADSNYDCCTSSGGVAALDSKTGNAVWFHRVVAAKAAPQGNKKNSKPFYGPSGAAVWSSPTIDAKRGMLYIGTGQNYSEPVTNSSDAIQAINIKTGKLVWNFQATKHDVWNAACPLIVNCPDTPGSDLDFGMAPVLVRGGDGKERLLAGQKSGVVYALEPQTGKLLWKTRIGKGGMLGGIHWGMATDGKKVYAANADNRIALNPDDPKIAASPGIYALDVINGNVVWATPSPPVAGSESYLGANSAAPAVIPGIVFAGGLDGHIRGYAIKDGHVIWDYNTIKQYNTTNGLNGNGGSIDGPSPVIADGMLFVNSGYAQFGEKPGNVLLAFEVKK